jgi:hypothetical protein
MSRRMVGTEMVIEAITSNGEVVSRYYMKQGGDSVAPAALARGIYVPDHHSAQIGAVGASAAPLHAPPDFSGRWLLERIDGDMESLLFDAGFNWALRKIAKGMKYGIGKAVQDIQQDGDSFVVVHETGYKTTTNRFRAGAGDHEAVAPDGSTVIAKAHWDGDVLHTGMRKPNGSKLPSMSRRMVGTEMVIESSTSSGEVVSRYYVKQGGDSAAVSSVASGNHAVPASSTDAQLQSVAAQLPIGSRQAAVPVVCPLVDGQHGMYPVPLDPASRSIEMLAVEATFGWF